MTQSKRVAVTGGLGSGKSAALSLLKARGYPVFSCDEIYAELATEESYLSALSDLFPGSVKEGVLDRAALSRVVFSDEEARKRLNALSHPLVMERLLGQMKGPLSFAEVPLLFEGGFEGLFDETIVVLRNKEARLRAVEERSGLTREEALARMAAQYDYSRLPRGVLRLPNDGSMEELARSLDSLLARLAVK